MPAINIKNFTLRDAFKTFYLPELKSSGATPNTIHSYGTSLTRWERFSNDPPVAKIDNAALARFREAVLAANFRPTTFNSTIRHVRAVLRRIGPQEYRNPQAIGLLKRIPYIKLLREDLGLPRRVTFEEIDRLYAACEQARWPHCCVPAAEWWRTAVVMFYNLGPRRNDLFGLRTADVDLTGRKIGWRVRKTRQWHVLPLNDVVLTHLRGIWSQRHWLFPGGQYIANGSKAYKHQWTRLQQAAGVSFSFHDLRRTCASGYADLGGNDLAKAVLGHSSGGDVTRRFYLNSDARLVKAAAELSQPTSFRTPKVCCVPPAIVRTDWQFEPGRAVYQGEITISLRKQQGRPLAVLQALVSAGRPLSFKELASVAFWDKPDVELQTVKGAVCRLRAMLAKSFRLPPTIDPVPWDRFGNAGWVLALPADISRGMKSPSGGESCNSRL